MTYNFEGATATLEDAKRDLELTWKDQKRLDAIIENLELFIKDSGGEDRKFLLPQLWRFQKFQAEGNALIDKIHAYIKTLPKTGNGAQE